MNANLSPLYEISALPVLVRIIKIKKTNERSIPKIDFTSDSIPAPNNLFANKPDSEIVKYSPSATAITRKKKKIYLIRVFLFIFLKINNNSFLFKSITNHLGL